MQITVGEESGEESKWGEEERHHRVDDSEDPAWCFSFHSTAH